MSKHSKNIFEIFFSATKIYISNFLEFTRVMLFPIFGQIIGIIMILGATYIYTEKYLAAMPREEIQQNIFLLIFGLILSTIPGFWLFVKAFWDYLVAMVSLNTMAQKAYVNGSFGNFKEHNISVNERTKDYVLLLLIIMGIWLIPIIFPLSVLPLGFLGLEKSLLTILSGLAMIVSLIFALIVLPIVSIYMCLSYQAFAFEEVSAFEAIKKSFLMIKGNFWRAVGLAIVYFVAIGVILKILLQIIIGATPLIQMLAVPVEGYIDVLRDNPILTGVIAKIEAKQIILSEKIVWSSIDMIIGGLLLPLATAIYAFFYQDIKENS